MRGTGRPQQLLLLGLGAHLQKHLLKHSLESHREEGSSPLPKAGAISRIQPPDRDAALSAANS